MIIIGEKERMAISLSFDEFHNDDYWIAWGSFVVYIKGFAYGRREEYATPFCRIVYVLKKIIEENLIVRNNFKSFPDKKIAEDYIRTHQDDEIDAIGKTYLGLDWQTCRKKLFDLSSFTESAFDDDSCMLMFRDENEVKLIGFQIPRETQKIINVNSITLARNEFDDIIRTTLDTIYSERDKYFATKREGRKD